MGGPPQMQLPPPVTLNRETVSLAACAVDFALVVHSHSAMRSPPSERVISCPQTCPLLPRVFPKLHGHHTVAEFAESGKEPKDEDVPIDEKLAKEIAFDYSNTIPVFGQLVNSARYSSVP